MQKEARNHIIRKQMLEINFEDISDGFALRNTVSEVFYTRILPQMETLFNEFADEKHLISFDVLNIDCDMLSAEHWEQELADNTIRNLRKELLAADKLTIANGDPAEKNDGELLYFLKHGRLPWNSSVSSMKDLEGLPLTSGWEEKLKELVQTDPQAAERLVYGFSEKFVTYIIRLLTREDVKSSAPSRDDTMPPQRQLAIQAKLIQALCSNESSQALLPLIHHADQRTQGSHDRQGSKKPIGETKKDEITEGIYIHNAGLVILHPYLPTLFEACHLWENGIWQDETSPHTAMILLEYLVSGGDEYPEFHLPFNKILCGLPPDEVLKMQGPLSASIKEECDNMLRTVIQHWTALKNTGLNALRETFLQRYGKLTAVDSGWLLQVEQKAVDILLGHLPWGIGTIRLPWMDKILYTEWC